MLWAALLLSPPRDETPQSNDDALRGLATWALQFTPRVAISAEAVTLEVEASARLFGGKRALRDRVVQESSDVEESDFVPNVTVKMSQRSRRTG
jgi:protein ImuB